MKNLLTILVLALTISLNGQLVIDDFTTGTIEKLTFADGESERFLQTGGNIVGKARQIFAKVNQNPYGHNMQLSIKNGLLVMTYAYDTRGTTYVNYGVDKNGNAPMNLKLDKYKTLKIKFAAKSTVNGIYVSLFTGTSRGVYSKHVQAREGTFDFEIPLIEIKKIGEKYNLKDIDYIRFQFDSRSKTGCNMAIDKIWFE